MDVYPQGLVCIIAPQTWICGVNVDKHRHVTSASRHYPKIFYMKMNGSPYIHRTAILSCTSTLCFKCWHRIASNKWENMTRSKKNEDYRPKIDFRDIVTIANKDVKRALQFWEVVKEIASMRDEDQRSIIATEHRIKTIWQYRVSGSQYLIQDRSSRQEICDNGLLQGAFRRTRQTGNNRDFKHSHPCD